MRDMHSIAVLDMDATPLTPKIIYTGKDKFYGITRENPHDGALWVNFNGSYGANDKLVRLTRDGASGLYAADATYTLAGSYYFSSCPFFEDLHAAEAKDSEPIPVAVGSRVDLCDKVEDADGFRASVLFSNPAVRVGGWEVQLEDHHTLKIISAPTESAEVVLKAFSCGLYSDVKFSFSLRSVPGYTLSLVSTGEGTLKVLRGGAKLESGDKTLREGDKLVITAEPKEGFILKTLVVNGADFESGKTFTVGAGDVKVVADFVKAGANAVESELLSKVVLAPNPCAARLTLRGVSAAARWEVYTVQGQLVACGVSAGEGAIEISTAGWTPGLYCVRLEAADGVRVLTVVKE